MNSNKEYDFYIKQNYTKNDINIIKNNIPNKNNLLTDSDNEEFFKKNYDTEKIMKNKNINDYKIISNTAKSKNKDINNMGKIDNNYYHINCNIHDNTIPISKKSQKNEIQNIDKILNYLKEDNIYSNIKSKYNDNYENNIFYKNDKINNYNNNIENIEELQKQKEMLIIKLKRIKQKNKELMAYLEPYEQSMTNEDIANEQRLKYIKYLDDKRKEYILKNNKLKHQLMNNQNINIKKKIKYLINNQIKEYEKLYNNDLSTNENINEIKIKNIYTNNNIEMKCELSLSGVNNNSDYKLNNATTDGLVNSKHKNIINENLNNKKIITKNNKLNKNSSIIIGEEKNKNNNSLKFKKNNSKSNFLSSIKYIKNSKNTRNNNTSSSITSSHDNNNINSKNNVNKKNDFKLLKPNTKMTNGINFGVK